MKTKSILSNYTIFVHRWQKKVWSFIKDISILSPDSERSYPKLVRNRVFVKKFPLFSYNNETWNWIKKSEFFVVNGLSTIRWWSSTWPWIAMTRATSWLHAMIMCSDVKLNASSKSGSKTEVPNQNYQVDPQISVKNMIKVKFYVTTQRKMECQTLSVKI